VSLKMRCFDLTILFLIYNDNFCSSETFRAAVVEHAVLLPQDRNGQVSREEAKKNMLKNLQFYTNYAEKAASQGADIIVFPEDGIYGPGFSWSGLTPYLEYIPDPNTVSWVPCTDPGKYGDSFVQEYLSCLARNNSMYLVANMGDIQPCDKTDGEACPKGHYQYNTDVSFDSSGRLLARYHKQNLFFEFQFTTPKKNHPTVFDTPFGRFGMFTCFDILFENPPIDLVETMKIRNIAFPTAWMDVLPHLAAIEFHSAFAADLKLNFLAANIHWPENRFHGSGIYSPTGPKTFYYNNSIGSDGKLLIKDLDVIDSEERGAPSNRIDFIPYDHVDRTNTLEFTRETREYETFYSHVFHDLFKFQILHEKSGYVELCNNGLCCSLSYEIMKITGDEMYAFGAFRGMHTYQGRYFIEVCLLLKCASKEAGSCGQEVKSAQSTLKSFSIQGNFSSKFVFPEILLSEENEQLSLSMRNWTYDDGKLLVEEGFSNGKPLISSALFGRNYDQDKLHVQAEYKSYFTSNGSHKNVKTTSFIWLFFLVGSLHL
ncbi:hypothetical protein FSP39_006538, partial [Pinctada imbricata]